MRLLFYEIYERGLKCAGDVALSKLVTHDGPHTVRFQNYNLYIESAPLIWYIGTHWDDLRVEFVPWTYVYIYFRLFWYDVHVDLVIQLILFIFSQNQWEHAAFRLIGMIKTIRPAWSRFYVLLLFSLEFNNDKKMHFLFQVIL